jgi:sulfur carrier protein
MIEIELNGAPHPVADDQNLQDLVMSLELTNQALAVAVNREVVPRQAWSQRLLQARDRVDIVRAIGGG